MMVAGVSLAFRTLFVASLSLAVFLFARGSAHAASDGPNFTSQFSLVGDYPLGQAVDRTDYESLDADARRLYIAKMGGGELLVFDIAQNKLVAQLEGFPKITGVLVVPELRKVYASVPGAGVSASLGVALGMIGASSGSGVVEVRDIGSLSRIARLPGGVFPDGIAYDPVARKVFVSDEFGSAVTVFDATTDRFVAHIKTGGEVGNVRFDPSTDMAYVPDQSDNELLAIDPAKNTVSARFPLAGCDHPHGLIVAPRGGTAYAACDGNDRLVTVALATGRVLNVQPVAHDPDVLAIDDALHRLYVAGESGRLSTFDIADAQVPKPLGDVFVAEGAHAVAVDPASHRLYFALANLKGTAQLRVLAPRSAQQ